MKVEGKIEKYNKKEGLPSGIMVNGAWYNSTDKTEKYVANLKDKLGSYVHMDVEDKKIVFINMVETEKPHVNTNEKKELVITVGMTINNEAKGLELNDFTNAQDWAKEVCDYVEALIVEMSTREWGK